MGRGAASLIELSGLAPLDKEFAFRKNVARDCFLATGDSASRISLFALRLTMARCAVLLSHTSILAVSCRRLMKSSVDTSPRYIRRPRSRAGLLLASLTLLPLRRCGARG